MGLRFGKHLGLRIESGYGDVSARPEFRQWERDSARAATEFENRLCTEALAQAAIERDIIIIADMFKIVVVGSTIYLRHSRTVESKVRITRTA